MGLWLTEPLVDTGLEQVHVHGSLAHPAPAAEAEQSLNRRAMDGSQARRLL